MLIGRLKNNQGSVLIVVLLLLLVISIMVPMLVMQTTNEISQANVNKQNKEAFYIAEAGLEHTKSLVRDKDFNATLAGEDGNKEIMADNGLFPSFGTTENYRGINYTRINFNEGKYYTRVLDNMDDGDVWKDSDNVIMIDSIGISSEGLSEHLEARVRKINLDLPQLPGAVTLVSDQSVVSTPGSSFKVNGNGTKRGSLGPELDSNCPSIYALVSSASGIDLDLTNVDSSQKENFTGVEGNNSITTGNDSFTLEELQELRERILSVPDAQLLPGSMNGGVLGSEDDPGVFYSEGAFTGSGNLMGYGILVVNNQFMMKDDFQWNGLIIIGGCPNCQGKLHNQNGNPQVYGGVIIASNKNNKAVLQLDDNAEIHYSCSALSNLNSVTKSTFRTVSWKKIQ